MSWDRLIDRLHQITVGRLLLRCRAVQPHSPLLTVTAGDTISRQLASTLDLEQLLHLVLERGLQATQADRGVISLYETEQHTLRLLAQVGYPPSLERYRTEPWPDTWGITGRVARSGCPAIVPDVSQDPDYIAAAPQTRSQLSLPINYEGRVIGIITLESDRPGAFTAEHLQVTTLLAEQAAIGIYNAQLFQQVKEGRDRLEAILNSTSDAVLMLDRTGRATLANRRVGEMFGLAVDNWLRTACLLDVEQLLKSDSLLLSDLDTESLARWIYQLREHPDQPLEISFRFAPDDRYRFVEGTISPVFNAAGQVIGHVAVLRDVTRRQELEQFREDLTSMVIHNLQGPLAALISSLEALSSSGQENPEISADLLRIALSSAQKLYRRIDSVLWIRRLEDKKMPLDFHVLPLPAVIEMALDEYRALALTVGVKLETHYSPPTLSALIDEEMIGRVFGNLLDNALKFTPEGGRIQVQATLVDKEDKPYVLCSVSDTGAGIAQHVRETIFEKFRRGAPSLPGRRRGMGLGLYFCKLAVEAHGGQIWVEGEKGQGTTFYFTLPAAAH